MAIKRQHLHSSVGQAMHLPAELLGDIYADPYAKKTRPADRDLPMAGRCRLTLSNPR